MLIQKYLLIALGWFFILLGIVGVFLPILPTTPFLIIALALFSRSSPRFHQMLLSNKWFGETLQNWEESRTISRSIKQRASLLVVISFSVSIAIMHGRVGLQIMLVLLSAICLVFIWRQKEE